MRTRATDVLVLGAGVIGLTTGVCLAETGLRVRIWTSARPAATTSAAAGAMWGPYLVEPRELVLEWSRRTFEDLRRLSVEASTGVRMVSGIEASRTALDPPPWGHLVPDLRPCAPAELPAGFAAGFRMSVPLVDMPVYLDYLEQRFRSAGGQVDLRKARSLDETANMAPVVVNCTGLGARDLVPDPELWPIRGQLVVVENPGIDEFFSEDTGPSPELTHIYPHKSVVVLGGTADSGNWNLDPNPEITRRILERCTAVEPRLSRAPIVDVRVGLRPTRAEIRVSKELLPDGRRHIHNYGHGGAGVTTSWGCAHEVVRTIS